jgi:hypothetical protein
MDCVIGCSTNYDWAKIKYWVNSINESGFTGDKVMIFMNCDKDTVQKVSDAGFDIIAFGQDAENNLVYNSNMMVHVERFYHIYQHLKNKNYRYVITTDVKDVIFQKNPSEWLEINLPEGHEDLIFSSESIKYKDEPWGDQNLRETFGTQIYEDFKDNTIYNVGVLAGRGYAMKDLMMNIFASCLGRPIKICDQSTFNFLVSQHPYPRTSMYAQSEDGWACQLGTTADPSKIEQFKPFILEPLPKMVGDKVATSTGIEYTIVHQYDRVPEWRKVIEEKYDDK